LSTRYYTAAQSKYDCMAHLVKYHTSGSKNNEWPIRGFEPVNFALLVSVQSDADYCSRSLYFFLSFFLSFFYLYKIYFYSNFQRIILTPQ